MAASPDPDHRTVVECDYELPHLSRALALVAEHHEGRVHQALAVEDILFSTDSRLLAEPLLADLAAQIVFEVLVAVRSPRH